MYARQSALVCLLCVCSCAARSQTIDASRADLVVYLKAGSSASLAALDEMKQELWELMNPTGFRIAWRDARSSTQIQASHVAVVELRGVCAPPRVDVRMAPAKQGLPLASSSTSDGEVLPFSAIDCAALNRFLGPSLGKKAEAVRNFIYGRAMARLLAHELYHVLAHTQEHTLAGIAKPSFSIKDLLAEHFGFERAALDKLRQPSGESGTPQRASVQASPRGDSSIGPESPAGQ